jgi:hypothetical protein
MWNDMEHRVTPSELFTGNYLAEVIDVDDTPSTSGRVKVRVFPMMQELDEAVLPWAVPAFPLFEGAGSDVGSYVVPQEGSRVWVFFAAGSMLSPVYFANAPCQTDGPSGRTPTKKMWKTRTGHVIEIEDDAGSEYIKVTHKEGSLSAGNIKITAKSGSEVQLGAGSAVKKLLNEAAATLFNAHVHSAGTYADSTPAPVTGTSGVSTTTMGAAEETAETKAS